jgi:aminopeptidase N
VAEVNTRRFDDLTYARSGGEAEDVTVFHRRSKRNIAAYASEQKLQSRGRFFDEDDLVDYDVLDYDIDASFYPDREWMEGSTRMRVRVKSHMMSVLTMRFAETLNVSSVVSDEFGRLLFLRVRNQNAVLVNLPQPVARDFPLTLTINYSGRLEQQRIQDESVDLSQRRAQPDDLPFVPAEPKWLFSNRNYWYPQNQVTDYATARLRLSVPSDYHVVSSGIVDSGSPLTAQPAPIEGSSRVIPRVAYEFTTPQPVRYLAILISKMSRVDAATVALDIELTPQAAPDMRGATTLQQQVNRLRARATAAPPVGGRNTMQLAVDATRRQESRGRDAIVTAADILRLYASLIGDAPYGALTLAMVEDDLPGGHAPGYFAMINNPPPVTAFNWRNDPAAFQGFPEFFLAHEIAHQWFGQAVGWKNYHEQWLSEGFAQYLAALYAKERRGEGAFRDVLRQFRRWAIADSDQGPVYLGYRLGHIKGESRVFRALVYNKGAAVLHMLRRLIGDEAFFLGLRQFYASHRFNKAGTDDLRTAMEAASERDLNRFFERWIYDNAIPRLRFSSAVEGQELIVRFEQSGDIFDVPVTVGVTYSDGKTAEFVVAVTDATTEARFPLTGTVRSVEPNVDDAAVAHFDRR